MRKFQIVLACVAIGSALASRTTHADSPPPTEEQIEAQLKEAQKKLEAAKIEQQAIQQQLEDAQARPRGEIQAEVTGVLAWNDNGGGYYVRVRPKDDPKHEIRIKLKVGENKVLIQEFEELRGRDVVAKGELLQDKDGLYMERIDFKPAKHK